MERGRGGREGERERKAGREGGARAKPGNQLVHTYHIILYNSIYSVLDINHLPGAFFQTAGAELVRARIFNIYWPVRVTYIHVGPSYFK